VVGVRVRARDVTFLVCDTGPGIPEQHMRQIYDEFKRYQQPFDWGEQGLGLGLSICQRISRMLGHPLQARSIVGRGSAFCVTVPRSAEGAVAPAAPRAVPVQTGTLGGLRVLCVDNDPEILHGMRALLGRWQVEVATASTVDEALQTAKTHAPHVFLVDYHLHDRLDGLDCLDALRALQSTPFVGALLTADGRPEVQSAARERGYRLLTKPIRPASLRAFLAAHHQAGPPPAP